MRNLKTLFFVLAAIAITFSSCKKEASDDVDSAKDLREYLLETDMDLAHVIKNAADQKFVMGAPEGGDLSGKYIIDIRNAADFAAGRIENANNAPFTSILDEAAKADKPILVVCYTGQTACYATSLLRLYGYEDAQALKWGMSGWNTNFDKWSGKTGNIAEGNENWTDATAPTNTPMEWATFSATGTDGMAILKERVEAVVAAGFKTVSGNDVLTTPSNYFINNYFSEGDYTAFGHIKGANRILPLGIADASIKNLDPNAKIVTYCYTGQTSAVITAYLNVLGYDAYSMLFGMNGLYNSNSAWKTNQWGGDSNSKSLDWVE